MSGAPHLLLDIEGTTTPITFVTETLFPFARKRLGAYLQAHPNEPDVKAVLSELAEEHARELPIDSPPPWTGDNASARAYLEWLMDRDRKTTPLKTLQGMIWEAGFKSGELKAQVYDDVPIAFERWRAAGREIAIFSSGSVLAQKLLFAHTNHGDLTGFLSAYFDTTTGPKREADSYTSIAGVMRRAPQDVLFVSDVTAELDAARAAGLGTGLCMRRDAAPVSPGPHRVIASFAEVE